MTPPERFSPYATLAGVAIFRNMSPSIGQSGMVPPLLSSPMKSTFNMGVPNTIFKT